MSQPFTAGDRVRCTAARNHPTLREGKEYTVEEYSPAIYHAHATYEFPAYLTVLDEYDRRITAHASRFTLTAKE